MMGADTLSQRIKQPSAYAQELLDLHRRTYSTYWRWLDNVADHAHFYGHIQTRFGWTLNVTDQLKDRTVRNFLMQGNGAEILRLACCLATERGVSVCGPNQDSLLIEAPTTQIHEAVAITEQAMREASQTVLDGFEIRTKTNIFHHPNRYRDKDGAAMWKVVWDIIGDISPEMRAIAEQCR